jgi:DNA-directed RNA polymerase specialized sigma24 family protein
VAASYEATEHARIMGGVVSRVVLSCPQRHCQAPSSLRAALFRQESIMIQKKPLGDLSPNELFARCAMVPADEPAWGELFRRYHDNVSVAIYRVLGFPPRGRFCHLFADVVQRFHERLLDNDRRALLAFRGHEEYQAQAYLRKIASSAAYKIICKESRFMIPIDNDDWQTSGETGSPSPSQHSVEGIILLREAINSCLHKILHGQNKFRNMLLFKLAAFDGFKADEIVEVLGLDISSAHAVEQQIARTRQKLRDCLKR